MPNVDFRSRIRWGNDRPLDRSALPPFDVPPDTPVYEPMFISAARMHELSPRAPMTGVVGGLTDVTFSLQFGDVRQQFRQTRSRAPWPVWHFQGGTLHLDLAITVYVLDSYRRLPGALAVILEHELLHVRDELDLIGRDLPEALPRETFTERYLIGGDPIPDRMHEDFFLAGRYARLVHDTVWVTRHNANANGRHTGPDWERYQRRMDEEARRGVAR